MANIQTVSKDKVRNQQVKVKSPAPKVRHQIVYSQPRRVFNEKYLTPKGVLALSKAKNRAERAGIWRKYGKNRYKLNT